MKAEVFTDLDVAAAVGLMPESLSTSGVPLWFDQELLKAVAGSQVFFALLAEEVLPYDLLYFHLSSLAGTSNALHIAS